MEREVHDDVGFRHHPFGNGLQSDPLEGIVAGALLDIPWVPAVAPVAVGVDVALDILVDAAVAVVVEPFVAQEGPFTLFARFDTHHQAVVLGIGPVLSEGVADTHLGDVAVAVEVVVQVLVGESVVVVVHGHPDGPVGAGGVGIGKEAGPPVDIHHRHNVVHVAVDSRGDAVVFAVFGEQHIGIVEAHLAGLDLVAVDVAVDPHARFRQLIAGLRVVDDQHHDVAPLLALADRLDRREGGISLVERFERLVHLGIVVVDIEAEGNLDFGGGGCLPRGLQHGCRQQEGEEISDVKCSFHCYSQIIFGNG